MRLCCVSLSIRFILVSCCHNVVILRCGIKVGVWLKQTSLFHVKVLDVPNGHTGRRGEKPAVIDNCSNIGIITHNFGQFFQERIERVALICDRRSCIKNEKRELESWREKVIFCLLSHLCTPGQSLREVA